MDGPGHDRPRRDDTHVSRPGQVPGHRPHVADCERPIRLDGRARDSRPLRTQAHAGDPRRLRAHPGMNCLVGSGTMADDRRVRIYRIFISLTLSWILI